MTPRINLLACTAFLLLSRPSLADGPPLTFYDHGTRQPLKYNVNCVGSGVTCLPSGDKIVLTVAGGSSVVVDAPLAGDGSSGNHLRCPTCVTTARQILAGVGLAGGGALSTDVTLALANTAVSAGSYGDASHVGSFAVDAQGRLTTAASTAIAVAQSAVINLVADLAAKIGVSGATMTGPLVLSGTQTGTYTLGGAVTYLLSQALGIGTAQTAYMTLENTTAATDGAQQYSPMLSWRGRRWSGAASKVVGWDLQAVSPGNANGTNEGALRLSGQYDGVETNYFDLMVSEFGEPRIKNPALAGTFIDFGGSLRLSSQSGLIVPIDSLTQSLGNSARAYAEVTARHYASQQAAPPTTSPDTGAGTGGTCAILPHGTDTVGILEIVAGTSPASGGATICTTTLNTAFNNKVVCTTSAPDNAAVRFDYAAGSTTTWVLKNPTGTGISGTIDVPYTCLDSVL